MGPTVTISRTDLARRTREVLELVRAGRLAVIESYGQQQAVLLDALDYRLLNALAARALGRSHSELDAELLDTLEDYLDEQISLGKTAELLGISRFELMERFERLGVPLNVGPRSKDEAKAEVRTARHHATAQ